MSKKYYGLTNLSKLIKAAKGKDPSMFRHENGDIFVKTTVWINDEPDEYGQILKTVTNPGDKETKKIYFGNFKEAEAPETGISEQDIPDNDDFPF